MRTCAPEREVNAAYECAGPDISMILDVHWREYIKDMRHMKVAVLHVEHRQMSR